MILNNITYINHEPPAFRDRFWEIRQMVDERNANIDINSSPSWKNCLDESMSKWLNKYTCPGFMFVPRKPWPFRNEWHDIGCADTNVIWQFVEQRQNYGHSEQENYRHSEAQLGSY